jgi:protoporphyrinogen oxidase
VRRSQKVIIIGAGITGFTAAYQLVRKGFQVTVVEASAHSGGLAGVFQVNGRPVDKYYHFICRGDQDLIDFTRELGLLDKLAWREAGTAYFVNGRIYDFNTPLELLLFRPIPLISRLRFGLHVFACQHMTSWKSLDQIPAKKWLINAIGLKAYNAIWDPLLRIKFGASHEQISAAWIWHRIHRVARSRQSILGSNSYGFFEEGCFTLLDGILAWLEASGSFELQLGAPVSRIVVEDSSVQGVVAGPENQFLPADVVISTAAVPAFLELVPTLGHYSQQLASLRYLGVICFVCALDKPFTGNFWLNVNDPALPLNGIIETTNLNSRPDLRGTHLLYIPFYLDHSDPRWSFSDDEIRNDCFSALQTIHPGFDLSWVQNSWVFRDTYAQAVGHVGFADALPSHVTPVTGLYLTDSSQYYPEDRTLSASVRLARTVADLVTRHLLGE